MANRKLTKRGSRRRSELLAQASRLFAEGGYHGTTVGDVCDALGVGKGVFYWYFDSKEELFRELLQNSLYQLRRAQQQAIADIADPVDRIARGIGASIEFFRETPGFLALIRIAARYEEFAADVRRGQEIVVDDVARRIKEGMASGAIRDGDAELMAHGILGAIFHFVEAYFDGVSGADLRPQLADEAVAFCLRGILRDPGRS